MSLLPAMLDLVYPRVCGGCGGEVGEEGQHLCWDCLAGLVPVTDPYCERCGDPVDGMIGHRFTCGPCNHHEPGYDRARSAVRYRGAVCDLLQGFKYNGQVHAAVDLARLLEACVGVHYASVRFDAVAYVPLYRTRERARTYNQAQLLAARVARTLGLTLVPPGSVVRVRDTGTQTGLNAGARRDNVRQAFAVSQPEWMEGRTLLLVDDVMTTGATVSSCSQVLKEAGAAGVFVVTVARG